MLNSKNFMLLLCLFLSLSSTANNKIFELKNINHQKSTLLTHVEENKSPIVHQQAWKLDKSKTKEFSQGKNKIVITNFPLLSIETDKTIRASETSVVLTKYDVFAKNAKIYKVTSQGKQQLDRPNLIAYSSFKNGVGILINPKTGEISGYYNHQGVSLDITGNIHTTVDLKLQQEKTQNSNVIKECAMKMENQPKVSIDTIKDTYKSSSLAPQGSVDYEAIIAVDTDNEWMAGKGNNTTTAMNFITTLFVNMNVYYERDFATRLLIGDTFLRTTSDPFPTQANILTYLSDFGSYWRFNQTAVDRDFALLLSGQNIASNSFSGIAWLNLYCENGFSQGSQTPGSYSVNRMGTSLSVGFVSQFVGHELGHNFGSPHTHCYNPVVDQCYNAESGCYTGAVSCPAGGSGTIMSYCHFGAPNGAGCGISDEIFHPTVISQISGRIVANSPPMGSCLDLFVDPNLDIIFANSFE